MKVHEALNDPTTGIGKSSAILREERTRRLVKAQEIMSAEGLTPEDAMQRVWDDEYHALSA